MKVWRFKSYTSCESYKQNKDLVKKWFYECKNIEDVKKLIAFLYSVKKNDILDSEIEKLIGEISKNGLDVFLEQYYKFRNLGFTPNILII